jgi:hypothetical protein
MLSNLILEPTTELGRLMLKHWHDDVCGYSYPQNLIRMHFDDTVLYDTGSWAQGLEASASAMQHEMKAQRITPACVVACAGGRIQRYIHKAHARKKRALLSCMHPLFPLAGLNSQAEQRRDLPHSKHARSAIAISRATQARFCAGREGLCRSVVY